MQKSTKLIGSYQGTCLAFESGGAKSQYQPPIYCFSQNYCQEPCHLCLRCYWLKSFYFGITDLHEKSEDSFDNDQNIEIQEHLNENIENELVNVDIKEEDSSEVNDSIQSPLKRWW